MTRVSSVGWYLRMVLLPVLVLGMAVAAGAWIGQKPETPKRPPAPEQEILVETVPVQPHVSGLDIEVDGTVVPFQEVSLATEVAGRIVHKNPNCRAGYFVHKDELLFKVDPEFYQLQVEQLTQELNQSDLNIEELDVEAENTVALAELAQQQLDLQMKQMERMQRLSSSRAASDSAIDEERRNELTARNNLLTLQNQVRILQTKRSSQERAKALMAAKLKQAKLDLAHTEIRAPFDGVILSDVGDVHEYVQPGTELLTLQDSSAIEVLCSLRMEELRWLWEQEVEQTTAQVRDAFELPKTPATVIYELGGNKYSWTGELSRYDGIGLDERTRTVPCRVLVPNPRAVTSEGNAGPRSLMRGMFVTVRIHVEPKTSLLEVPEKAVRPGNLVWLVRKGKLEIVPVEVARIVNKHALLPARSDGIAHDDRLVVSPLTQVTQGMPVQEVRIR